VYWLEVYQPEGASLRLNLNVGGPPSDVPSEVIAKLLSHAIDQLRDLLSQKAVLQGESLLYAGKGGDIPTLLRKVEF
jgi:hypothetical protein